MSLPPEALADAGYAFGLWTGWALLHSVLAARRVKAACALVLGPTRFAFYPLGYAAVSLWTFQLVWSAAPRLPQTVWSAPFGLAVALVAAQAAGLALLVWAGWNMGLGNFLGLPPLFDFLRGRPPAEVPTRLLTAGAYGVVRHPMHLGGLLILLCAPRQTLGTATFSAFACLYLLLGTFIEERRMAAAFGREWAAYAARTPLLWPHFSLHYGGLRRGR